MWTTVPFIQESFSNCDILFRAWFDTDRIWVTFLRMVRLCLYFFFILNYYYYLKFHAASWTRFFVLSVCSFMHAPCHYFSIGVKKFPLVNMRLCPEPASLGHVWHDSELLLQPWGISINMTSVPTLSIYFTQKKKQWKRGERKSSHLPQVKWIDFKDTWAFRKLTNYLYCSWTI